MKLEKGPIAATRQGMRHNIEVMKQAGYSDKRAVGTAYGEAGLGLRLNVPDRNDKRYKKFE